jgi:hypothetical protein
VSNYNRVTGPEAEGAKITISKLQLIEASARSISSSQRDRMIVARHEVPGIMRKIAPSQRDG